MSVVIAHTTTAMKAGGITDGLRLEYFGNIGVYIFFIISGFIMMSSTYERKWNPKEAIVFIVRRLKRIIPTRATARTDQSHILGAIQA